MTFIFNPFCFGHRYIFDYLKIVDTLEGVAPACFQPPAAMACTQLETDDDDSGGPTAGAAVTAAAAKGSNNKRRRPRPTTGGPAVALGELASLVQPFSKAATQAAQDKAARFEAWAAKHGKSYNNAAASAIIAKEVKPASSSSGVAGAAAAAAAATATSALGEKVIVDEKAKRQALFTASERFVSAMNRRGLSFWLETNHLADWTHEERKSNLNGRLHTPKGTTVPATTTHEIKHEKDLPESIDWRELGAVTPPKDQVCVC